VATDADVAWVRRDSAGTVIAAAFVGGTSLRVDGAVSLRAGRSSTGGGGCAILDGDGWRVDEGIEVAMGATDADPELLSRLSRAR
jgi:hypothetical protein